MRYEDSRRSGGKGYVWLRWRVAMRSLRIARQPRPPYADLMDLDDHLLEDIGVRRREPRRTWRELR
jgi:uncharacterized protein YjiS (DUF1127 family)